LSPFYKRWWFWVGLSVAAGFAAGGTFFGLKALRLSNEWKKNLGMVDDPQQLLREGKSARTGADILIFTGAGIALGTIIGAAVVGLDRERPSRTGARVLPSCTGTGCSLTLSGQF
jgi:hypothetical protein